MTPRPKYSRGCHACRRMKVKCDEQKPQCKRCVRGGRKCPGFPEISNFLSMNSDFEQGSEPLRTRHIDKLHGNLPLLASPASILSPSTDWEQQAKAYFFANFVSPDVMSTVPGHMHFLHSLLRAHGHVPVLRDAMRAVSVASFANVSGSSSLQTYSHQLYGQALRSIRDAVASYTVQDSSAIMASMYLLQKREASP
ncbi:hypothetical protein B0I35DRAFT_482646 [Stachybotrys elegans]|uniref:Zn(2)-C6 fungal-type domain-containing protein n=1 Tax=Stachybotrys elegans TaxID=80388 RepID=A0A8K0SL95_9HYPO|nr:hypothetical protein B0I35DRAFT_482646 [Stachybotrys elegans]